VKLIVIRSPEASWHSDYRDSAYIYIGGLPFELSEGDIITIFSQFGEPTFVNLIRDKETGKSKGFAFLKYEDQRSTDLAVDNLGGTTIMNRTLRVDHTRYKKKDDELEGQDMPKIEELARDDEGSNAKRRENDEDSRKPITKQDRELLALMEDHDDEDPMKAFLIQEKKDQIAAKLSAKQDGRRSDKSHHRRHHHTRHRSEDRSDRHRKSRGERGERGDDGHGRSSPINEESRNKARQEDGRRRTHDPRNDD
jgi:RNA-binding motif X-linked protein 2